MAVTMKDVRAALDPEEPDYDKAAAELGPEALPHLKALVTSGDAMLASKAAYLASMIPDDRAVDVVEAAARSDDPIVRVAAAAAVGNLAVAPAEGVLRDLAADADPGVRKVARGRGGIDDRTGGAHAGTGPMPGEKPQAGASSGGGRMPGEGDTAVGDMPGGAGMSDAGAVKPRKRGARKGEMPD